MKIGNIQKASAVKTGTFLIILKLAMVVNRKTNETVFLSRRT